MVCGRMFPVKVENCDDADCPGHEKKGLIYEPAPPVPLEERLAALAEFGVLLNSKPVGGSKNN